MNRDTLASGNSIDVDALIRDMAIEHAFDGRNLTADAPRVTWGPRSEVGQWLDAVNIADARPAEDNTDAPLVVTGQGSYTRHYTPELRSAGRRRGSIYRWAIGAIVAVTFAWWRIGW